MTARRDMRLRREVRRALAARRDRNLRRAIDEVLSRPLERGFYVEIDSAIVMDRARRSKSEVLLPKSPLRAAMWADIFAQVDALLAENPSLTRVAAICRVLSAGTSPRGFYITPELAFKILKSN